MLVSSATLILNRAVLLWIIAYFLIKDPVSVYSTLLVVVLSQSTDLPNVYVQSGENTVGLLAIVIALTGLEDFVGQFAEDPHLRLETMVPIRLLAYFGLTAAAYFRLGPLGNAVVFTYGFVEMLMNFWIYVTVREEINEKNRRAIRKERGQES